MHGDECESVKHAKQGSSASGKTLKHLTLTHTHYTHTTTILVQEFGAFDIDKYHLCLKSQLFRFITGFNVFNRKCSPKTLRTIGYFGRDV